MTRSAFVKWKAASGFGAAPCDCGACSSVRARDHIVHVTSTPFDRLNVLTVQNAAALRYQTW